MGFIDRLLGREEPQTSTAAPPTAPRQTAGSDDDRAVERYRYLLRTAPPEQIEQAHEDAFANLTVEQRREVLTSLSAEVPVSERARDDDPKSLARMATRAEMRQPGTLERSFSGGGGMGGGMGLGGVLAGSLLASVAGSFIGTAIAGSMLDGMSDEGDPAAAGDEAGAESGDGTGGEDVSAGGYGEDPSAGGDFGGGEFGGGEFGGGEF